LVRRINKSYSLFSTFDNVVISDGNNPFPIKRCFFETFDTHNYVISKADQPLFRANPMLPKLLSTLFFVFWVWFQDSNVQRQVMRKHPNGKPYVVMFFKATTQELSREEVYFPNGQLQWTGSYKNDVEHGVWKYYFENGKIKSEQNYINGKEDGTFVDYNEKGMKVKETVYVKGKIISEKKF
jgi:hypothetical protein